VTAVSAMTLLIKEEFTDKDSTSSINLDKLNIHGTSKNVFIFDQAHQVALEIRMPWQVPI
jgi:hypothetical protein